MAARTFPYLTCTRCGHRAREWMFYRVRSGSQEDRGLWMCGACRDVWLDRQAAKALRVEVACTPSR